MNAVMEPTPGQNTDRSPPLRVMLVDDNDDVRDAMSLLLPRLFNLRVTAAFAEPQAALERLGHDQFDLVLVDFKMPGMNGITFTEEARRRPDAPPILLISFNPMAALREAAVNAGAAGMLSKSDLPIELRGMLQQLFPDHA